tara:strand:- start:97499 stop:97801 length:303 start_codon:yes stop_codon:yes gene_type:complete
VKVNPYVFVGGLASIAIIYVAYTGNKAGKAVGDAASSVGEFVSNENLFSETADNFVDTVSEGRFRDLGDVFFWMAGKEKQVNEALRPSVPLREPSTAIGN